MERGRKGGGLTRAFQLRNVHMRAERDLRFEGFQATVSISLWVELLAGNGRRCHWTGGLWQDGKRPDFPG